MVLVATPRSAARARTTGSFSPGRMRAGADVAGDLRPDLLVRRGGGEHVQGDRDRHAATDGAGVRGTGREPRHRAPASVREAAASTTSGPATIGHEGERRATARRRTTLSQRRCRRRSRSGPSVTRRAGHERAQGPGRGGPAQHRSVSDVGGDDRRPAGRGTATVRAQSGTQTASVTSWGTPVGPARERPRAGGAVGAGPGTESPCRRPRSPVTTRTTVRATTAARAAFDQPPREQAADRAVVQQGGPRGAVRSRPGQLAQQQDEQATRGRSRWRPGEDLRRRPGTVHRLPSAVRLITRPGQHAARLASHQGTDATTRGRPPRAAGPRRPPRCSVASGSGGDRQRRTADHQGGDRAGAGAGRGRRRCDVHGDPRVQ